MIWYRRHAWCPFCGATHLLRIIQRWAILVIVVEERPRWRLLDGWPDCKGNRPPRLPRRKRRRRRSWRRRSRHSHPW